MDKSRERSRSRSARRSKTPTRRTSVPPDVRISRASVNPFFNFLADYRKSNTQGLSMRELTLKGAKLWREMSEKEKLPYVQISKEAQKYRTASRRRSGWRSRRRRRGGRRRRRSVSDEDGRSRSKNKRKPSKSERKEDDNNDREDKELKPSSSKKTQDQEVEQIRRPDDVSVDNLIHPRISYDSIRRDYI